MVGKKLLYNWLIAGSVFLAPLNLFLKFSENAGYINGILSDYRIFKLWIGEIPVLILLALWGGELWPQLHTLIQQWKKILSQRSVFFSLLLGTFLIIRQYFTATPTESFWYAAKVLEITGLFFFLRSHWKIINLKIFSSVLFTTIIIQIALAQYQFFSQTNLFPYKFLGETQLNGSTNIARAVFADTLMVLPYGTTAHPNILAGFLTITGIVLLQFFSQKSLRFKKQIYFFLVVSISWTLFLTQSISAWSAWLFFFLFQTFPQWKKKISGQLVIGIFILIPFILFHLSQNIQDPSLERRVFLNTHAFSLFLQNPIWGTGLNQSLASGGNLYSAETARFLQPVHNVLFLWILETGIIGAILLFKPLMRAIYHKTWLACVFLPLVSLDHYLLTQWMGGIIVVLFLLSSFTEESDIPQKN